MNNDVTKCFERLADIYEQQMLVTADPDETTRRYEDNKYALAVELSEKGYDVTGWDTL